MRRSVAAAALCLAGSVQAAAPFRFDVPVGTLEESVIAVGNAAGITVAIGDRVPRNLRVGPLKGRMDVRTALRRITAGTGAEIVQIDPEAFLVRSVAVSGRPARPVRDPPAPVVADDAIVVTGSKRGTRLAQYPGTVQMVDARRLAPDRPTRGSDALVEQLPILASTHLGPGRDKLFIRGLADSSFAGPSRATVGQYLGDVRLNYNAPDPDLALHDIREVEILEGPQGTLYGAGSLGGIIRLEPEPPDPARVSGEVSLGLSPGARATLGADADAVLNLPIASGAAAVRIVGYASIDGGYIDDVSRGLTDINRTSTRGARATVRIVPGGGWTFDVGGVVQDINSRDGQYAERELPPLSRRSAIAQPFDNDYRLVSLVARRTIGDTSLVSATSFVSHDLATVHDATSAGGPPLRYASDDAIHIISNETRLSRRTQDGLGWIAGLEVLHSSDRLTRNLGPPGAPSPISGTRNIVEEASVYGETTFGLLPRLKMTAGGRLSYDRQVSERLNAGDESQEPRRRTISVLPSVGLMWRPSPRLGLYARYQEGYRPGGLAVQAGSTQRFDADSVGTSEIGFRFGRDGDRIVLAGAVSYASWENIQADLVDAAGLPYTANVGSGRVIGVELSGSWRPFPRFVLEGAFFADSSRLARPAPGFGTTGDSSLPNIPDFVGRLAARYSVEIAGRPVSVRATARHVGRSRLGVGPLLDIHQGGYAEMSAGASVDLGRASVSLDAANLANEQGNVFALGNPFGVMRRDQVTPLRPTTVRVGVRYRF